jgi:hypothetical protein
VGINFAGYTANLTDFDVITSFQPAISSDTTVTVTYSRRFCSYTRINNLITFSMGITVGTVTAPGSGSVRISIPVTSTLAGQSGGGYYVSGGTRWPCSWEINTSEGFMRIIATGGGYLPAGSSLIAAGCSFTLSGTYYTS